MTSRPFDGPVVPEVKMIDCISQGAIGSFKLGGLSSALSRALGG